jgi:hypothetical protein
MRLEPMQKQPSKFRMKAIPHLVQSWSGATTCTSLLQSKASNGHKTVRPLMLRTKETTPRQLLLILSVLLLVVSSTNRPCVVFGQSSYDYGYDDDENSGSGGYVPKPPPVVDNLYHDYAARQEAKVGMDGGIAVGGYVMYSLFCLNGCFFFLFSLYTELGVYNLL